MKTYKETKKAVKTLVETIGLDNILNKHLVKLYEEGHKTSNVQNALNYFTYRKPQITDKGENTMSVAIKVISRVDDKRFLKSMDFEVLINGESDNTEYRMTEGEKTFKKLFSVGKAHGYSVRGKVRNEVQNLVNAIFDTNLSFAIAIEN